MKGGEAPPRVVVTGFGAVSPLGPTWQALWEGLLEGRTGFAPVTTFDTSAFRVHRGAEVREFDPGPSFRRLDVTRHGRASQLAVAAARAAVDDAGLELDSVASGRVGVVLGTTSGEPREIEAFVDATHPPREGASAHTSERLVLRYPSHLLASAVAAELDLEGPCIQLPCACAAGNYALAQAFELLRSGRAEAVLAGGADAFSRITFTGFARLGAIAPEVCAPFDLHRQGMIPGEAAGVLVLETEEGARRRGAHVRAEILGYGLSCDAHHMTAAAPDGDGPARAMSSALAAARLRPDEVSYVNAHGTGTRTNDLLETRAIRRALGPAADAVPVSSIKSMLGHTMGAASALEAIACCLATEHGVVPPTRHLETPDPECDLDYVPEGARAMPVRVAMSNSSAFGGNNAAVVFAAAGSRPGRAGGGQR